MKIFRFYLFFLLCSLTSITHAITEKIDACTGESGWATAPNDYYGAKFFDDANPDFISQQQSTANRCDERGKTGAMTFKAGEGTGMMCYQSCACPEGYTPSSEDVPVVSQNYYDPNAKYPKPICTRDSNNASSSSSSSSSAASCPAGQIRDSNGSCSTCSAPQVLNIATGQCSQKTECTFPEKYSSYDNACHSNPNNCANHASYNPLTEEKCASSPTAPEPSCPSGWTKLPDNTCVKSSDTPPPDSGGGSSGGENSGGVSASSSGAASSTPSSSPSASSTPANNSNSSARPPYDVGDNIDQGQPTDSSTYIPKGISQASCLEIASSVACKAYENCGLTFGGERCVGISSNLSCPNTYVVNGQKLCVLPSQSGSGSSAGAAGASGSGSNGSAGKGECDPTAKSYDECMGRNKTPSAAETAKITDDLNREAKKAIDDYNKAIKDDIDAFQREGIGFKNAPDQLRSSLNSLIPSAGGCQDVVIEYHGWSKSLNCSLFENFKLVFGWFLSIVTIYYIFQLAIKPVNR